MYENDNQLKPKCRCFLSNDGNIINSIHNICKSVSEFLSLVKNYPTHSLFYPVPVEYSEADPEIGDEGARW